MYYFLKDSMAVQTYLESKFQVSIAEKAFTKNNEPYLLINIPSQEEQLVINNKKMKVVGQHFTMPKRVDESTNSIYHYTLELKDNKDKSYITHLYFDSLDKIKVEPMLKLLENDTLTALNISSMKEICAYSLASTTIISSIRKAQKEAVNALIKQIEYTESELQNLSKNTNKNKPEHIKKLNELIELFENLESKGVISRKNEKKFYIKFLQKLNETSSESNHNKKQKKKSYSEHIPQKTIIIQEETSIIKSTPSLVEQKRAKNRKNNKNTSNLIKECQQCIKKFDEAKNPYKNLIEDMINKVVELGSIHLLSELNHESLFETKSNLISRIRDYFNVVEHAKNDLYILAVKANIISFNDTFLIELIKNDNVNIINQVLSLNLITDSEQIHLPETNSSFTLVEWCVYFDAVKCFNCLLESKFSLDYIDEENSPFLSLLDNPHKSTKFEKLSTNSLEKLGKRLLSILEKRKQTANGDELALIKINIKNLEVTKKILGIWKKDRKYALYGDFSNHCLNLDLKAREAAQHHIGFQESRLRAQEAFCQTMETITSTQFIKINRSIVELAKEKIKNPTTEDTKEEISTDEVIIEKIKSMDLLTKFYSSLPYIGKNIPTPLQPNEAGANTASNNSPPIINQFKNLSIADKDTTELTGSEDLSSQENFHFKKESFQQIKN